LKEFVDVTASAEDVARTLALRGFEVASIEALDGGDAVIDFEVTANRPDALSVLGLAREVATAYDLPVMRPGTSPQARVRLAALATGTTNVFPAAIEDRFHQPYREALVPGLHEILRLRAPGLLGCALSGAGPSILVFFERGYQGVCELVEQIFRLHGHASETLQCSIPERGFELTRE